MNKKLTYLFLLFLVGCSGLNRSNNLDAKASERERLADEILYKVAIRLKKEKGLQPFGSGGGTRDGVRMLALSFMYNKPIEIKEGRELLVEAVETFVSTINSDERIRPYLKNYPFEPKNVEIRIFIKNPDFSEVAREKLCIISEIRGMCDYDVHDSETDHLKTVYEETFSEAKERVNNPSLPMVSPKPDSQKVTQKELAKFRKSIGYIDADGNAWEMGDDGIWRKNNGAPSGKNSLKASKAN